MDESVIICDPITPNQNKNQSKKKKKKKKSVSPRKALLKNKFHKNSVTERSRNRRPLQVEFDNFLKTNGICSGSSSLESNSDLNNRNSDGQPRRKKQKTVEESIIILSDDDQNADDVTVIHEIKKPRKSPKTPVSRRRSLKKSNRILSAKIQKKAQQIRRRSIRLASKKPFELDDDSELTVIYDSTNNPTDISNETQGSVTKLLESDIPTNQLFFIDTIGDSLNFVRLSSSSSPTPENNGQNLESCEPIGGNAMDLEPITPSPKKKRRSRDRTLVSMIPGYQQAINKLKKQASNKGSIKNSHRNGELREIIVDGPNIALGHKPGQFSQKGLELVLDYFHSRGHNVRIFLPQHYRNKDRKYLEDWHTHGLVVFTPSRRIGGRSITPYDDRYILEYATRCEGIVVSSDQYRDLYGKTKRFRETIEKRLLAPTFVGDELIFPHDPMGRFGPKLNRFLKH